MLCHPENILGKSSVCPEGYHVCLLCHEGFDLPGARKPQQPFKPEFWEQFGMRGRISQVWPGEELLCPVVLWLSPCDSTPGEAGAAAARPSRPGRLQLLARQQTRGILVSKSSRIHLLPQGGGAGRRQGRGVYGVSGFGLREALLAPQEG